MKHFTFKSNSAFANHNNDIDLHVWTTGSTPLHAHEDYYEIFYVSKGPIKYIINDRKVQLNKGALTIVRPQDIHMFDNTSSETVQHVNIAIKNDYFKNIINIINPFLLTHINNSKSYPFVQLDDYDLMEVENWRRRIYTTQSTNPKESISLMVTLLFLLLSIYNLKSQKEKENIPSWLSDLLIKVNSHDFINKTVSDMYELSHYSPPILIRNFKKYLNTTPSQYLINVKINYACNLLRNTDYSILTISGILGYDSLSHFNHTFKKIKGESPSVFRKKFL